VYGICKSHHVLTTFIPDLTPPNQTDKDLRHSFQVDPVRTNTNEACNNNTYFINSIFFFGKETYSVEGRHICQGDCRDFSVEISPTIAEKSPLSTLLLR
jgi:hypothetical protein